MNSKLHLDHTTTGIEAHTSPEVRQGLPTGSDQFPAHVEAKPERPWSHHADGVNLRLVHLSLSISEHHLATRRRSDRHTVADHFIKEPERMGIQGETGHTGIDSPGVLRLPQDHLWGLDRWRRGHEFEVIISGLSGGNRRLKIQQSPSDTTVRPAIEHFDLQRQSLLKPLINQ